MSSSRSPHSTLFALPVAEFEYRQMVNAAPLQPQEQHEESREPEVRLPESTFNKRLATERAQAIAETEARLRHEYEQKAQHEAARVSTAIAKFEQTHKDYFARVEGEVVQLSLAIARKILHREAQVDPLLVGAIVQLALGQLKDGTTAVIRVRPEDVRRWSAHFNSLNLKLVVNVVEDAGLQRGDCILESDLGNVNFSLETQLKEVEQGFFDVLAQKPQV